MRFYTREHFPSQETERPRGCVAGRRREASRRIAATTNNVIYRDDKFSIAVSRQVTAQNPLAFFSTRRARVAGRSPRGQ